MMPSFHPSFAAPAIATACLLVLAGCQEPNYRNEVTTTAQGGVEVHRVAKSPAPPRAEPATPADSRIAELEAQVRQLQAENARLKGQTPTTVP